MVEEIYCLNPIFRKSHLLSSGYLIQKEEERLWLAKSHSNNTYFTNREISIPEQYCKPEW